MSVHHNRRDIFLAAEPDHLRICGGIHAHIYFLVRELMGFQVFLGVNAPTAEVPAVESYLFHCLS